MANSVATVTSSPVSVPSGIRVTTGNILFDSGDYATGGTPVSVAQFGGGSNGIPNRKPDIVLFGDVQGPASTSFQPAVYIHATGKVAVYGTALTDDVGITEEAAAAGETNGFTVNYVAIWVTPDPSGVVTV